MVNNNNNAIVHSQYQESSIRLRTAWMEYKETEGMVKYEIVNMIILLQKDGYSRMEALKKIIDDHNDLEGFSKASIYRALPDDMKDKKLGRPNFSREKLGQPNSELEKFRQEKGKEAEEEPQEEEEQLEIPNEDEKYDELEPDPEREIIYSDPIMHLEESQKRYEELLRKYEEVEQKYEQVIIPFEAKGSVIAPNGQEIPIIGKVDPFKKTISFEIDQKEVKKLKRF